MVLHLKDSYSIGIFFFKMYTLLPTPRSCVRVSRVKVLHVVVGLFRSSSENTKMSPMALDGCPEGHAHSYACYSYLLRCHPHVG